MTDDYLYCVQLAGLSKFFFLSINILSKCFNCLSINILMGYNLNGRSNMTMAQHVRLFCLHSVIRAYSILVCSVIMQINIKSSSIWYFGYKRSAPITGTYYQYWYLSPDTQCFFRRLICLLIMMLWTSATMMYTSKCTSYTMLRSFRFLLLLLSKCKLVSSFH